MSNHTQAPWEINGQGWDMYITCTDDPDTTVCKMEILSDGAGDTSVTVHNANLITAAPELLAACKALLGDDNPSVGQAGHIDYAEAVRMARFAIAKAQGEHEVGQ